MKNLTLAEEGEARAVVEDSSDLIEQLLGEFVKQSTRNGYVEISKESVSFVVTMRLERKKENDKCRR